MDKFYPTQKVVGNRIILGEPRPEPPEDTQTQAPAQSWTLPAVVAGVATALVTIGVYAFFDWLEKRGARTD